jgi:hypothetical protein
MDAAQTRRRKFPSMTTDALKVAVMDYQMGIHKNGAPAPGLVEAMIQEVKDRQSGVSKHFKVPQVGW